MFKSLSTSWKIDRLTVLLNFGVCFFVFRQLLEVWNILKKSCYIK